MSSSTESEAPTQGSISLRVEFAASGTVRFTLEPDAATPRWHSTHAELADPATLSSTSEAVSKLMTSSMAVITGAVPSARDLKLEISLQKTDTGTELVAAGPATFLASEWQALVEGAD